MVLIVELSRQCLLKQSLARAVRRKTVCRRFACTRSRLFQGFPKLLLENRTFVTIRALHLRNQRFPRRSAVSDNFWNCRSKIRIKKEKDVNLGSKADDEKSVRFQRYGMLCSEARHFCCEACGFASIFVVEHVPSVSVGKYCAQKRIALVDQDFSICNRAIAI
jgi:hypothetical protein